MFCLFPMHTSSAFLSVRLVGCSSLHTYNNKKRRRTEEKAQVAKDMRLNRLIFSSVGWARMPYFTPLFFLPPEALNAAARTVLRPCGFPFFFRPKTPLGLCFPTSLRTELLPLLALWPSKIAPDFSPPSHFDFCSFFFPLLTDGTALRFSRFRS